GIFRAFITPLFSGIMQDLTVVRTILCLLYFVGIRLLKVI
ncbi:hypothetical protein X975_12567, partial [Stegodyphus mimosarum]